MLRIKSSAMLFMGEDAPRSSILMPAQMRLKARLPEDSLSWPLKKFLKRELLLVIILTIFMAMSPLSVELLRE